MSNKIEKKSFSHVLNLSDYESDAKDERSPYDQIFASDKSIELLGKIGSPKDIPIASIEDFPNHPFPVNPNDKDFPPLLESVKEFGIRTPVTVRSLGKDRYQMVSGHRRKLAALMSGLTTIPAIVLELSDEEAVVSMVDSNIQREGHLPSTKAKAYKMKKDAIEKNPKIVKGNSHEAFAADELLKDSTDSKANIYRFLKLNDLIPELLKATDDNKIGVNTAYELAYIDKPGQEIVLSAINECNSYPNIATSKSIRAAFEKNGQLTKPQVMMLLAGTIKEPSNTKISNRELEKYIPGSVPHSDYSKYIIEALKFYNKNK